MKVGILGSGVVGQALAAGFLKYGHEVMVGTRDRSKLAQWAAANPQARTGSFADAASFGDLVALAVKGGIAGEVLRSAGAANLSGKVVMDVTNPIADLPPVNGVLRFFTTLDDSLLERLQREFPEARLVKAFNSVGNANMVDPKFPDGRPTMFICGSDSEAKRTVSAVVEQFGWEAADMGAVEAARAIEPLCMLWCIPGLLRNEWTHAFKVLHRT